MLTIDNAYDSIKSTVDLDRDSFIVSVVEQLDHAVESHYQNFAKELAIDYDCEPIIALQLRLLSQDIPVAISYHPYPDEIKRDRSIRILSFNRHPIQIQLYRQN